MGQSMKKPASETTPTAAKKTSETASNGRIHPVVIYPFQQPRDSSDLEALYQWVAGLDRPTFARPITVIDRKTHYRLEANRPYLEFREHAVARHSDILDAWCVDTCQMWYAGLGAAWEKGAPGDVYWLIPGDFDYGTATGKEVLSRLRDLPEIVLELGQDLCIGEIATDHNHSKQLIDTYATFALLYNWFPLQAQEIRETTERPRSEFFAIGHAFLGDVLNERWYAYEQTMVMLLKAVFDRKRISRFLVGGISDLPQGREPLEAVIQQVERTERVLKTHWRERNQSRPDWIAQYRALESQSGQIRQAALIILTHLLA